MSGRGGGRCCATHIRTLRIQVTHKGEQGVGSAAAALVLWPKYNSPEEEALLLPRGLPPPCQAGPTSLPGSGRPPQTSPRASTALTNQPPQLEPPSRPNRATAMQSVFAMFIVHYQWPRFCVYNRTTVYAALPSQLVIMRHDCIVAEQPSDIVHRRAILSALRGWWGGRRVHRW